jgi:hypothetical protein
MGTKKSKSGAALPQAAKSAVPAQRITQADGESTLSGVFEAALEIARKRRETLARMREALENGNDAKVIEIAREFFGVDDEKKGHRTDPRLN